MPILWVPCSPPSAPITVWAGNAELSFHLTEALLLPAFPHPICQGKSRHIFGQDTPTPRQEGAMEDRGACRGAPKTESQHLTPLIPGIPLQPIRSCSLKRTSPLTEGLMHFFSGVSSWFDPRIPKATAPCQDYMWASSPPDTFTFESVHSALSR